MKDYIEERVLSIANYIIESGNTVREAAKVFKVSKSTVHKDITERLPDINPAIYKKAREILDNNKAERHLRGGMATKQKYKRKSKCKEVKIAEETK
ncbi:sporulation transcriptional regulator SpoIIID [Alkalibaculum bacchi]|uniref:sporulation transcriptional regulator SpoIIID n=1 Tax=Alkalibaculum bacchi TaxID=645887 RepID=UPI0026F13C00|nr:sporulation transcriptional regulator SpoIIID [Alkalibaculum bacchi]